MDQLRDWMYKAIILRVTPVNPDDDINHGHLGCTIHSFAGTIIDYWRENDDDDKVWLVEVPTVIEAICLLSCKRLRDGTKVCFTYNRTMITEEWQIDDSEFGDLNWNRTNEN